LSENTQQSVTFLIIKTTSEPLQKLKHGLVGS